MKSVYPSSAPTDKLGVLEPLLILLDQLPDDESRLGRKFYDQALKTAIVAMECSYQEACVGDWRMALAKYPKELVLLEKGLDDWRLIELLSSIVNVSPASEAEEKSFKELMGFPWVANSVWFQGLARLRNCLLHPATKKWPSEWKSGGLPMTIRDLRKHDDWARFRWRAESGRAFLDKIDAALYEILPLPVKEPQRNRL